MKHTLLAAAAMLAGLCHVNADTPPRVQRFFTNADLSQALMQPSRPDLAEACRALELEATKREQRWSKLFPPSSSARPGTELMAWGRENGPLDGHKVLGVAYAIKPSVRRGVILREMLLAAIGARQAKNYWRPLGIHEAEAVMSFLEACDIASQKDLLSKEDWALIRDEMRRAGQFLEGWTLENGFSAMYEDQRVNGYCLNFHTYAAASTAWIALFFPELPESRAWLARMEESLLREFLLEQPRDGASAEGSLHYWYPTMRAVVSFMVLSRNMGHRDYFQVPVVASALRRSLHWRLDMSAPDGRAFAVGDSDREACGARDLQLAGVLLGDRELVWGSQLLWARGTRWSLDPYSMNPVDLLLAAPGSPASEPKRASALYQESGYAFLRSSWKEQSNALFLKFGPSYFGRRQAEEGLIISGHAHQDNLQFELHHRGQPVLADIGRRGRYPDYDEYAGFVKATVAHSTVGLGNEQGLDRLDGKLEEHRRKYGAEFTYEKAQMNIAPRDTRLIGFGDVGAAGLVAARVRTYPNVVQRRAIVWFAEDSLTVVHDRLESDREQNYEWYLTPVGRGKLKDGTFQFGDEVAGLRLIGLNPPQVRSTLINKGDVGIPSYYTSLLALQTQPAGAYAPKERWGQYSLLVLGRRATNTEFLNVLIPRSREAAPWNTVQREEGRGLFKAGSESLFVSDSRGNSDASLLVHGSVAVVRTNKEVPASYALIEGTQLGFGGRTLLRTELVSSVWGTRYSPAVTGIVSIASRRASFSFALNPMDTALHRFPPRIEDGKEPTVPVRIAVSFYSGTKPRRIVVLNRADERPDSVDTEWEKKKATRERDPHANRYLRNEVAFSYDEASGCATMELGPGPHQLVWE